ncbi:MAG: FAD-dependent oxidoreductase [Elusimicrobiota bacterium]|jgi:protoporphyrinogen oxidase|nr:FAD-dependent oxidoreductase [Elusimicrobiota bacterium]
MENRIVIMGAGLSGLALAYNLESCKKDYALLEAKNKAGGLCASYKIKDFTFDYGGHLLHLNAKRGLKMAQKLLGKNILLHKRRAFVHIYGRDLAFPFQNNLYGLDEKIVSECVNEALKAYKEKDKADTALFKNWALALYGKGICKHFMFPYNQKLWQTDLGKLTSDWCGKFVPASTLEDIIKGAYAQRKKDFGYNAHFFYPKTGGSQALVDALLKKARVKYKAAVTAVDLKNKTIAAGGKTYGYDKLVSTLPLPLLGCALKDLPANIKKDFAALKHNSVYVLNIAATGKTKDGHWYYFPEDKYPFFRVGVQSSFAKDLAIGGSSSFYVEFAAAPGQKPDFEVWQKTALAQLKELGFIETGAKILVKNWVSIPQAYPIYDAKRKEAVENIANYLRGQGVYLLGRYGAWEYSFMEKSLLDAADLALEICQ